MINPSQLTVREIGERLGGALDQPPAELIELLEGDARAGVRRIASSLRRSAGKREDEKIRIRAMLRREQSFWERGIRYVAGVDEVGVGPFAGPVVAAAVVFPCGVFLEGVRDSKRLTHERRVALDAAIRGAALAVGVGLVDVDEIDRLNIFQASLKAMRIAILDLKMRVQHVLVDGRAIPDIGIPQEAIPGGDNTVFSIAAASIVAKVYRDGLMTAYDRVYPQYGFARHKGYGTGEHIRALNEHGPCEIHRRSFDWGNAVRPS